MIGRGDFDHLPLLRFRLSSFCGLAGRIADDALTAWAWLRDTASQQAADRWKLESTIVPEVRKSIALHLRAAGKNQKTIERIDRMLDVREKSERAASSRSPRSPKETHLFPPTGEPAHAGKQINNQPTTPVAAGKSTHRLGGAQ
jgi:hypothetical protein